MATFRQGPPAGGNSTLPGKRGILRSGNSMVKDSQGYAVRSGLASGDNSGSPQPYAAGATQSVATQAAGGGSASRQALTSGSGGGADVQRLDTPVMPGKPLDDTEYEGNVSVVGDSDVTHIGDQDSTVIAPEVKMTIQPRGTAAKRALFGRQ